MQILFKKISLIIFSSAFIFVALWDSFVEPDFWLYLNFGREVWKSGEFLRHDVFSYLPVYDQWISHEWLAGVILYPLHEFAGGTGIQVLKYALGLGCTGFCFFTARLRGGGLVESAVCIFLIHHFLTMAFPGFRAQCFTYFLFAAFLWILEKYQIKRRPGLLYWLIPLCALWANLHGGFVSGLGIIGIYALAEAASEKRITAPLAKVLLICAAATLVNPYGVKLWGAVLGHAAGPDAMLEEWMSVFRAFKIHGLTADVAALSMVIAALAILAAGFLKREAQALLLIAATALLSLLHMRHAPFAAIVFAILAPGALTEIRKELASKGLNSGRILKAAVPGVLLLLMFLYSTELIRYKAAVAATSGGPLEFRTPVIKDPLAARYHFANYPCSVLPYLDSFKGPVNLLTHRHWAGYIVWAMHPKIKTAVDGRHETVFPEKTREDYLNFMFRRQTGGDYLDMHPHGMVLIESGSGIHEYMLARSDWKEDYNDGLCAAFTPAENH